MSTYIYIYIYICIYIYIYQPAGPALPAGRAWLLMTRWPQASVPCGWVRQASWVSRLVGLLDWASQLGWPVLPGKVDKTLTDSIFMKFQ